MSCFATANLNFSGRQLVCFPPQRAGWVSPDCWERVWRVSAYKTIYPPNYRQKEPNRQKESSKPSWEKDYREHIDFWLITVWLHTICFAAWVALSHSTTAWDKSEKVFQLLLNSWAINPPKLIFLNCQDIWWKIAAPEQRSKHAIKDTSMMTALAVLASHSATWCPRRCETQIPMADST